MTALALLLQIFLPGTQPGDIVNWPLRDNLFCIECHGQYSLEHYEPWDTWSGSMMANSSRDPLFWAAVDIANQDSPGIGEWCIRCHSPKTWLEGRSSAPNGSSFIGMPGVPGGDFEGVDCQFCHRLYEGPTGTPFLQNAQFWVDDSAGPDPPPHRGPYEESKAPHPWLYSEYHLSSALCALCHNVRNPLVNLVDETGADTGLLFPEQTTYDEWAQSSYPADGVQCQTCHMPRTSGFACTDFSPTRQVGKHMFAGAGACMTSVLGDLYGSSLGRTQAYEQSANLALDMLQNQSANLLVSAPSRMAPGSDATIRVRAVNLTGHKLPTGYPEGRRMWIHLEVTDGDQQTMFESGRYDFAAAELVPDPDLRVYETVHGIHGDGPGFHLALSNRIFKDTRIPPAGFVPTLDTAPVGITFATIKDGSLANWDEALYVVPIPAGTPSPITIRATLYDQAASKQYFEFLRDENTSGPDPHDPDPDAPDRGTKMYSYWEDHERCPPIAMKTTTRKITLDRIPPFTVPGPDEFAARPDTPIITTVGPNPFREDTWIEFRLPQDGIAATVQVFDITGRKIQTLLQRNARAKERVEWNGRGADGQIAAAGAYFLRLDVPGYASQIRRIILMR
jgi:hypothetical protein